MPFLAAVCHAAARKHPAVKCSACVGRADPCRYVRRKITGEVAGGRCDREHLVRSASAEFDLTWRKSASCTTAQGWRAASRDRIWVLPKVMRPLQSRIGGPTSSGERLVNFLHSFLNFCDRSPAVFQAFAELAHSIHFSCNSSPPVCCRPHSLR